MQDEIKANEKQEAEDVSKNSKSEVKEIESKSLQEIKDEILDICKEKAKNNRDGVKEILKDYNGNPANIQSVEVAREIYLHLKKM